MEVVAVAGSIAGIVSLTIQGIQCIDTLIAYRREFKEDAAVAFAEECAVSVGILGDVKSLCLRIEDSRSSFRSELRLSSLQLQVEDCVADMRSGAAFIQNPRRPARHQSSIKRKFVHLINGMFKLTATGLNPNECRQIQERFRRHQDNMKVALLILGSHLSDQLENLSLGFSSSSGGSSRDDFQTHNLRLIPRVHDRRTAPPNLGLRVKRYCDEYSAHHEPDGCRAGQNEPRHEVDDDQPEIQALVRVIHDFSTTALQCFDTVVAEYLVNVHAWRMLEVQNLIHRELEKNHSLDDQSPATFQLHQATTECATKLISLRKISHIEGLDENLALADSLLNVSDKHVQEWADWRNKASAERSDGIELSSLVAKSRQKDRLTRINEWLLGEMMSSPYLSQLHNAILDAWLPQPKFSLTTTETQWQRETMKLWFLDIAALDPVEEAASISVFDDLEATFRHLDFDGEKSHLSIDIDLADIDIDPTKEQPQGFKLLREPQHPFLGRNVKVVDFEGTIDLPPDGVSQVRQVRAEATLQEYVQEPPANLL